MRYVRHHAIILLQTSLVPVARFSEAFYIALYSNETSTLSQAKGMTIYFIVKWVGKWSVMDPSLFRS